jgi:hydroxyacylglutathione hydrolase
VIIPPSGNMSDYLASLALLTHENIQQIAPGHGDVIHNAQALIQFTIHHRLAREAKVLSKLSATPQSLDILTPLVYDDVNPALHPVARYSLHAHLIKLLKDGKVNENENGWVCL